jgi:CHAD domain-containing protein
MDAGYRILAARYVRRQAKQLAGQLDGVRAAEDVEFVHRARVAARRLRAALRMFGGCFSKKRAKRWRKDVRRLAAALGDARDRDVQIAWLCGALSELTAKECVPGVARALVQLEHQRERLQRHVVAAANHLEAGETLSEMRRAAKRILAASEAPPESPPGGHPKTASCFVAGSGPHPLPLSQRERGRVVGRPPSVPGADALSQIRRHVLCELDNLLERQDCLAHPEDRQRHHAMRIAAKRLRYTLEISRPAHAGRPDAAAKTATDAAIDAAIEAAKRVQTLLGDVHDCDVWLDHLAALASAERRRIVAAFGHPGRFSHVRPGIEHLQRDRRLRRRQAFQELVDYWNAPERRGIWDELRAALRDEAAAPGGAV